MRKINKFVKNNCGQLTIVGLLLIFLIILTLAAILPEILTQRTTIMGLLTAAGLPVESSMVGFIPMFIVVVLLSTIAMYGGPQIR